MSMSKENGRLLFIVDSFPPDRGGRVEKIIRRIKYLSKSHWDITILAPKAENGGENSTTQLQQRYDNLHVTRTRYLLWKKYPSLRHNKNRNLDIEKSQFSRILDFLFVPKGFVRWFPYAVYHGIKLAKESDVILSINNPIMLHLIGLFVSKVTRKPWVVELRDPIAGYAYSKRGPEFLNSWLEKIILQNADKIIRFEDSQPIGIAQHYPNIDSSRFVSIEFMGYEEEDFLKFQGLTATDYKDKLKIVYTGSFYGSSITPVPFLKALKNFLAKMPHAREKIVVNFAGDWSAEYDALIKSYNLEQNVQHLGYLSRPECLDLWDASHIQLLILGKEEDNIDRIPSKFYDYIGTKRPIFALVHPDGKVAQLIQKENLGFVADTESVEAISEQLELLYRQFEQEKLGVDEESDFREKIISDNSEKIIADTLLSVI